MPPIIFSNPQLSFDQFAFQLKTQPLLLKNTEIFEIVYKFIFCYAYSLKHSGIKYIYYELQYFYTQTVLAHTHFQMKKNQYLNLRPQGGYKFKHRRIHTEIQDPSTSKYNNDWQQNKKQPRAIESMSYIPTSIGYHPSKYQNKTGLKQHKEDEAVEEQSQNISQSHKALTSHRRTKTGIQFADKTKEKLESKKPIDYRNVYGSYQNLKTQGNPVQGDQKQQFIHKQSRFNRMKQEFTKYQASTAGTSTPTGATSRNIQHKYAIEGIAGRGTFGVVYFGRVRLSGQKIAIKKVLQDKRYKNRQLQILKMLDHQNLLKMKDHFLTVQYNQQEYLNVIMDYYPDNLYQIIQKKLLTPQSIKNFAYQALKGLDYLASLSIAHRDIKPQNILVDFKKNKLVICDFGSAKKLIPGESNISYICSRCYRAPELIFGATQYTPKIDIWSLGCVLVQMINGEAPFIGDSQLDQLLEIIKILGTPQKSEIQQMNPDYNLKDYNKFTSIKSVPWRKILKSSDPKLIDLIKKLLEYSPIKRLSAKQALEHPYFSELQQKSKDVQKLQIVIDSSKVTISKNINTNREEFPKKQGHHERIEPMVTAKSKISNLSNQIKKQKEENQFSKNEEEKKINSDQYNINIMNNGGSSNININIHNINIPLDSDRQFVWQKHRLLPKKAKKLKDEMVSNAQGESIKVNTYSRNPNYGEYPARSVNFGMNRLNNHGRIKSDLKQPHNDINNERYNFKKQDTPALFYKHQFFNKNPRPQ